MLSTSSQNAQHFVHPKEHSLIMDCSTLSKVPGRLRLILETQKLRCRSASLFPIGAEHIRGFKCPYK